MMKKLLIFGIAALLGLALVVGPIATTNVQAAEKAGSSWVYDSIYEEVLEYIIEHGEFNFWSFSIVFNDEVHDRFWEIYLFQGYIIVWEKDMPREGTYFISLDAWTNGLGLDGFGLMQEDGSFMGLSDADIYKVSFHRYLCDFWWSYCWEESMIEGE